MSAARHPLVEIPRGVWAIASGLSSVDETLLWADRAHTAQAFSFRVPQVISPRISLSCLHALRERAPWLAVHAHFSWAALVDADALISNSRGLPVPEVKTLWNGQLGVSAHSLREAQGACTAGATFSFASPIWQTPSKVGILAPVGLDGLRKRIEQVAMPAVALGGITTPEQVAQCAETGAHAVAVLRAAREPKLLGEMAQAWREATSS